MKIYVKPREDYVGTPGDFGLPADGAWVPRSSDKLSLSFWLRRVRAGDVTKHDGPPPEAKPEGGDGSGDGSGTPPKRGKGKGAKGAAGGDSANSADGAKGDS